MLAAGMRTGVDAEKPLIERSRSFVGKGSSPANWTCTSIASRFRGAARFSGSGKVYLLLCVIFAGIPS